MGVNDSAVNMFAGPGGSCLGAVLNGYDPLGIEYDAKACETREAAGLRTLHADMRDLEAKDYAGVDLLIGSAPCPSFSTANAGRDQRDVARIMHAIRTGEEVELSDPRSELTLLAYEWARDICPRFLAFEQVPAVLAIWGCIEVELQKMGYSTWCGVLEAERYGVPQTRERAILLASAEGTVHPPSPSHQRYVPGLPAEHEMSLFGDSLQPWVSMAEALGWGMTERPCTTVMSSGEESRCRPLDGGARSREVMQRAIEEGHWRLGWEREGDELGPQTEDGKRERDTRPLAEPAFTLTEKARSWSLRAGNQPKATERPADEPAPTIAFGHASYANEWVLNTGRDWKAGEGRDEAQSRPVSEPAPTLTGAGRMPWQWRLADVGNTRGGTRKQGRERRGDEPAPTVTSRADQLEKQDTSIPVQETDEVFADLKAEDWPHRRPATTIAGDHRVFQPGGHHANDGRVSDEERDGRSKNAIRIEPWEAGVLQGFPPNYPWRGSRTAAFSQIGNAVPPPLAAAYISAVLATAERK